MKVQKRVLGGALLISGTTIGAAMLVMPVVTGLSGFWPTLCLFLIYWCYMTFTAFLILELNLWLGEEISLVTMAKETLGKVGEAVAWITVLFLLYTLTTAYLAGGGRLVVSCVAKLMGVTIPNWVGSVPLLLIFGFFVFEGTKYVDILNRFLMLGLVIAYGAMVIFLTPHIEVSNLSYTDWNNPLLAVSLLATSFGYHVIIPSLTTYMHHDARKLTKAILIGSIIPLVVYILWEAITLGVIPLTGDNSIVEGYKEGASAVELFSGAAGNGWVTLIAQFFSFFAIITSFLGVTLSLSDFLADGFHIKKTLSGRVILFTLTFMPPLVFILTNPRAFINALELAGAFGVVILLGLLPPVMVWSARYWKKVKSPITIPGGKPVLLAAILFSVAVVGVEIANKLGLLESLLIKL
ncbi:MAG: amino acid permease [Waddliaceae bacterium]